MFGLDFVVSYKLEMEVGSFMFLLNVIYIIKYDLKDF